MLCPCRGLHGNLHAATSVCLTITTVKDRWQNSASHDLTYLNFKRGQPTAHRGDVCTGAEECRAGVCPSARQSSAGRPVFCLVLDIGYMYVCFVIICNSTYVLLLLFAMNLLFQDKCSFKKLGLGLDWDLSVGWLARCRSCVPSPGWH